MIKKIYLKIKSIISNLKQIIGNVYENLEKELNKMTPEARARWYSRFFNPWRQI